MRGGQSFTLQKRRWNLLLGVVDIGSVSLLVAVVLGAVLADAGASDGLVALAVGAAIALGGCVIVARYLPMSASLDVDADELRYRNAWRRGRVRWSDVVSCTGSQVIVGHEVVRVELRGGRRVRLRGAPFDEFVARLGVESPP